MIHTYRFLPQHSDMQMNLLQRWGSLKQDQLNEAANVSKETLIGFIKRQIERGNWQEVAQLLKGKPMAKAGKIVLSELRDALTSSLILRLGLRRVVAVGLATVLLPLILAKITGEVVALARRQSPR